MSHCSPSGPAVCNRTRAELDALLERCDFGAKEAMFACYFERGGSDKQPLCIACKQPIARHAHHAGVEMTSLSPATAAATTGPSMGTVVTVDADGRDERVPAGGATGDLPDTVRDGDYDRTSTSFTWGLHAAIACAVTCFSSLLLTLFVLPFWLWRVSEFAAGAVFITGCVLGGSAGIGFFFAGCAPRTRTLHVARHPAGSPSRELFYEQSCVFGACCCSCCEDGLGMRHTVAEVQYVFVDAAGGGKRVELYTHGNNRLTVYDEGASRPGATLQAVPAAAAAEAWRVYLNPPNPAALDPPAGWKPPSHDTAVVF